MSRPIVRFIRSRLVRIGGGAGALLAVLWLILSSAFPAPQETACAPVSGMAVVQEVIDGDTVQLASGERIRYLGIDTPEVRTKRNGRWVYAPEPFAEDASALNRRLVEGRRVRLEPDREPCDRYRRHLAYLFVDDLFVNAELVRQGLAVVKIYPPNDKYRAQLQEAQTGAQVRRTGLWTTEHAGHGADQGAGQRTGHRAGRGARPAPAGLEREP